MFYSNGLPKTGVPTVGDSTSCGLTVKDTDRIMDGIILITFDENTQKVWLSSHRLEDHPDDIALDACLADIEDFETILNWYDIEYTPFNAYTGEYQYKLLKRHDCAEQCVLEVILEDNTKKQWAAICGESGLIEAVITDDGKRLTKLTELRGMGVIESTLVSTYELVDF